MDLYAALRIARTATAHEVKAAYRAAALSDHPDVNGGCGTKTARFKAATEAYEVLRDPDQRRRYDSSLGLGSSTSAGSYGRYGHGSAAARQREKVYAPRGAPAGSSSGGSYDFEKWQDAHYGGFGSSTIGENRAKQSDRRSIVSRLHERREVRRQEGPRERRTGLRSDGDESSSSSSSGGGCSVQ